MRSIRALLLAMMLPTAFINCSDVRLTPRTVDESVTASSVGEFCVSEPAEIKRYTKFLFIVDKSGSNNTTDPGAAKRAGSIERYYQAHMNDEWLQWSFIAFHDPGTQALIGTPQEAIFTDDPTLIAGAISRLRTDPDVGGTPYGAALALTNTAIAKDIRDNALEDNMYMVIFLSDGVPTDGAQDVATLQGLVRGILNLKPGKIKLSTGFYTAGASDAGAITRLEAMAEAGEGRFVNFQNNPDFNFDDLVISGPSREPWILKQLAVYNVTSTICEDGAYDTDSDSDGLCDKDEARYNGTRDTLNPNLVYTFDPANRFSNAGTFANYGDYFAWRSLKFGERPAGCSYANKRKDKDHDLLNYCEERTIRNAHPVNPWNDPTPVAWISNPDSDGDGIIDGIETFAIRSSRGAYALDMLSAFRSFDSEFDNSLTQLLQHRNPLKPDASAPRYDTRVTPTGINDLGQSCYRFEQSHLTLHPTRGVASANTLEDLSHAENENVILIYYIQTPQSDPNARGVLQYSFQKLYRNAAHQGLNGTSVGLSLNRFQSYIIPNTDVD